MNQNYILTIGGYPIKALIALSDKDMGYQIAYALKAWCHDTYLCETGFELKAALEWGQHFNLFFIDRDLPINNQKLRCHKGIDIIAYLRRFGKTTCKSVIIYMRNRHSKMGLLNALQEKVDSQNAGANLMLTYPVTDENLEKIIASQILEKRPFINHRNYVGPCHRSSNLSFRPERRSNICLNYMDFIKIQ